MTWTFYSSRKLGCMLVIALHFPISSPLIGHFSVPHGPLVGGGGLATVFKTNIQCRLIQPSTTYLSFELQTFELTLSSPVLCALIYRPPKNNKDFNHDLADFLSEVMVKYDHVLITGDLNVHVCCESKPLAKDFLNLIDSFNLTQSITSPTHKLGHILDLVLSHGFSVNITDICVPPCSSDHFPILFTTTFPCLSHNPCNPVRLKRSINPSTAPQFSHMFNDPTIATLADNSSLSVDALSSNFNTICTFILDTIAPFRPQRTKALSEPWINDTTRTLRQSCRRAERAWKKDKLQVRYEIFRDSQTIYQRAVRAAKSSFISNLVLQNSHKPQVLFNVFNSLINPRDTSPIIPSASLCENFKNFFIEKVNDLRSAHTFIAPDPSSSPVPAASLSQFQPISLTSLTDVVSHLRSTNCPSDCVPSRLLKEVFDSIGTTVLTLINTSLTSGCIPAAFKNAVVHPLIKKKNLDPTILSNFRPISQLPFLSKVLEKIVYVQLQSFLTTHGLHEKFQSGFKPGHSTETALLRVF